MIHALVLLILDKLKKGVAKENKSVPDHMSALMYTQMAEIKHRLYIEELGPTKNSNKEAEMTQLLVDAQTMLQRAVGQSNQYINRET